MSTRSSHNSHINPIAVSSHSQKILITGASGFIGRQICPYLESHGFALRSFDRNRSGVVKEEYEGQLEDLSALRFAAAGVDTIIHLAACSDDADFVSQLVPSNVVGLYHAFEAARLEGVRRFILAGSCQAADLVGRHPRITIEDRFPTDHYGLTKLWAEDMGLMYSWRYGLSVLTVRLGWVVRSRQELEKMDRTPGGKELFLSHRDLKEFFLCCLRAQTGSYDVVYALSKQIAGDIFDMQNAETVIGFQPKDIFPNGLDWQMLDLELNSAYRFNGR